MKISFTFHRFGEAFHAPGDEADARSYLDRLNHGLTSNFWSAMPLPGSKRRGRNISVELAKLGQRNAARDT